MVQAAKSALLSIVPFAALAVTACSSSPYEEVESSSEELGRVGTATRADVRDFGATPDDDSDDTAAFRRALATLGPQGTLVVPPGNYVFAKDLTLTANATLTPHPGATLSP